MTQVSPDNTLDPSRSLGPAQTTSPPPEAQLISANAFLNDVDGGFLRVMNSWADFPAPTPTPAPVIVGVLSANVLWRPAMEESLHQALKKRAKLIFPQPKNQAAIRDMLAKAKRPFSPKFRMDLPTDCSRDKGSSAVGSDRNQNEEFEGCATFSPIGLYANFDFDLKHYSTCVKDQGNRGSCVAFATVAAVESLTKVLKGRSVNLSEQHLYSYYKNWWEPDAFGDGADDGSMWDHMIQNGYVIPYEKVWDYNPSFSRALMPDGEHLEYSCVNYAETCTDSSHQSGLYCATLPDGYLYCGYMAPVNFGGTGVRATAEAELWNSDDFDGSLARVQAALDGHFPVVLALEITPSFDGATNGYIEYVSDNESSRGGHALELLGYIGNQEISEKLGASALLGAGGGYLIAKNSWSRCFGDSGYVYIPYQWLQSYTYSATVLTGLEEF